jgi:hypothetical protein
MKISEFKELLRDFTAKVSDLMKESNTSYQSLGFPDMYRQVDDLLYQEYPDEYYWLIDLYMDEGSMFAVATQGGKLYKIELSYSNDKLSLVGSPQEVVVDFKPVSQVHFVKQSDGSIRGFLLAATTVLNRNGRFNSQKLYDNFVENFDKHPKPYIDFFHLGKDFDMGTVDYIARDQYSLVASFVFNDSEIAQAMMLAYDKNPDLWGASISFYPIGGSRMVQVTEDVQLPCYDDGWLESITILPETDAQCLFTAVVSQTKEVNKMDKRVKEALELLAGGDEELLESFVSKVDSVNQAVEDNGLIHQNTEEAEESEVTEEPSEEEESTDESTDESTEEEPTQVGEQLQFELDDEVISKVAEEVVGSTEISEFMQSVNDAIARINKQIEDLNNEVQQFRASVITKNKEVAQKLEALSKEEDEKRQEWVSDLPAQRGVKVSYRAREMQSSENKSYQEIADETIALLEA